MEQTKATPNPAEKYNIMKLIFQLLQIMKLPDYNILRLLGQLHYVLAAPFKAAPLVLLF